MAKLVVITEPALAPGFRLAGVEVHTASTAAEAERLLLALMDEGEAGVIAVHAPYFVALGERTRRRIEIRATPVVMGLPTGMAVTSEERQSQHLAELIRRAIGFRITFRGEEKSHG